MKIAVLHTWLNGKKNFWSLARVKYIGGLFHSTDANFACWCCPRSSVFEVGGYEWKLEMYPYGDSQSDKTLSVFLCAVDSRQLPGWSQTAHYQIAVVNKDPAKTSTHTGYDIFRGKRDSAWGWSKLISLAKLHDASQGWVDEEEKITLQVCILLVKLIIASCFVFTQCACRRFRCHREKKFPAICCLNLVFFPIKSRQPCTWSHMSTCR